MAQRARSWADISSVRRDPSGEYSSVADSRPSSHFFERIAQLSVEALDPESEGMDERVAQLLVADLDLLAAEVFRVDPVSGDLVLAAAAGPRRAEVGDLRLPADSSTAAGLALCTTEPLYLDDCASSRYATLGSVARNSLAAIPFEEGSSLGGVLMASGAKVGDVSEMLAAELSMAADLIGRMGRHRLKAAVVQRAANFDDLTGLASRASFVAAVESVLADIDARPRDITVLFLDLDHFKVVNDSMGHAVGDELLLATAVRLKEALRPGDLISRFGGDEFTVLCDHVSSTDAAMMIAQRVVRAFDRPFELTKQEVRVGVSVGVNHLTPEMLSESDPDAILRDADVAMYQAKQSGRGSAVLFDMSLRNRAIARLETETDLRRALRLGQLRVEYQPIYSFRDAELVGFESLARWHHPTRGPVPPSHFITIAQESGLIDELDQWMLREAVEQAAAWSDANRPQLITSVNLSPRQLNSVTFARSLKEQLDHSGLDPSYLCLEIAEQTVMHDVARSMAALRACKDLGVMIAIDDFGTGFSSLSYLRRFPVDILKVDHTFVQSAVHNHEDRAIAAAIINLAHTLGMTAVAEGVETAEQLEVMSELDCDLGQGYFFATPRSARDISFDQNADIAAQL